ncbi:MAG: YcjF family protein [Pseudomonadota bacterium]
MGRKPVLLDVDDTADQSPATAPVVPDLPAGETLDARAMQQVARIASRRPSRIARIVWGALAGLLGLWLSVALWDFTWALIARMPVLGYAAAGLAAIAALGALSLALKEIAATARLKRIDRIQAAATRLYTAPDLAGARRVAGDLERLYEHRPDATWGLAKLRETAPEQLDSDTLLHLAERELLAPLDQQAGEEVAAAARQVAMVTALVPLALADVVAALLSNLRMVRRVAEIYGGRAGGFGTWRLMRAVMTHLVATGAVAVSDDMLGSVAGGGLLSKLSRRFGEGLVNGALTARVGVAAMEVCRPLPFEAEPRPSVSALVQRALSGLFSRADKGSDGATRSGQA